MRKYVYPDNESWCNDYVPEICSLAIFKILKWHQTEQFFNKKQKSV